VPWFAPFTAGEILRHVASEIPMLTFQHVAHVPPPGVTVPPTTMSYATPMVHAIPTNKRVNYLLT